MFFGTHFKIFSAINIANIFAKKVLLIVEIIILPLGFNNFLTLIINFFQLSDLIATVAPLGIFLGRLANFINVELYGRVTNFPFAIIYPNIDSLPRHPSQLYEAFFEGIILFLILYLLCDFNSKKNKFGLISCYFLFFYGLFRFFLEFLREPDSHLGLYYNFFTMGKLLSITMMLIGVIIYLKN